MSDIMRQIPFDELMKWVLTEYKEQGTIFGVNKFYFHKQDKVLPIFNERIETPFGPAAGPHTQLAQNIIASYVGGSRFFELKTVQIIDGEDLPVSKPCIVAEDECYNVEWSTELRVSQAFEEYVKGWFALKLLSREFGFGDPNGFVFNMSVGYDLDGIKSKKINDYIDGMIFANGTDIWEECSKWTKANLSIFNNITDHFVDEINSKICTSITLSTLHGCPPQEIEKIANYLIDEKKLNTYIKCNPTLLGYEFARKTMDDMGYDYLVFDDHHFKADLQFTDAVPMFKRLLELAGKNSVEFGVKLTNTFPVRTVAGELPGEEMYMSGKSLFPLAISLVEKLENEFLGKLRVSYSGGADAYNIEKIFDTGIWPITLATTLLKPGGYNRLEQMAQSLVKMTYKEFESVNLNKLAQVVKDTKLDSHHIKPIKPLPERKLKGISPIIDCFVAPCEKTCPLGQDIQEYIDLAANGMYAQAMEVICEKNPLPFITGTICSHKCMNGCTRNFYEEPIQIRATKLIVAENGYADFTDKLKVRGTSKVKLAIIGGGPAGIAAAYFAAREGAKVTVFEKRDALGGIVKHVIPSFRISDEAIDKDAMMLARLGVEIKLNTEIKNVADLLKKGYTQVIIAIGAWCAGRLDLEGDSTINVLDFLEKQKNSPYILNLGDDVVIIGGGNTAMDAARAAKRMGVKNVRLVYRRTKRYMPADEEELQLALEDSVEFMELLSPVSYRKNILTCDVMELGTIDSSGRRTPKKTGKRIEIPASAVICAVGEKVDKKFLMTNGIAVSDRGMPLINDTMRATNSIYIIGDTARGPATVAEAIADAQKAIGYIMGTELKSFILEKALENIKPKRNSLCHSCTAKNEGERCLSCGTVCESCVDVCPNRANISIKVKGMSKAQVIHIDKMCNECGNCLVFCPYEGAPYKDKFTLFANEHDFKDSTNNGFCVIDENNIRLRLNATEYTANINKDTIISKEIVAIIKEIKENYSYCI